MFIQYYSILLFIIFYGCSVLSHNREEFVPKCLISDKRFYNNLQVSKRFILENVNNIVNFLSQRINPISSVPTHIYIGWQIIFISDIFILSKDEMYVIYNSTMNNKIQMISLNKAYEYNLSIFYDDHMPFFIDNANGVYMTNTQLINTNNRWFYGYFKDVVKVNI